MVARYDLIIFDCDGTLVDSERPASKAVSEVLRKMGFSQYTPELCYAHFASISYEKMLLMLQMELGSALNFDEFSRELERVMNKVIAQGVVPMQGAEKLLRQLKGMPKCVASNGRRDYVVNSLEVTDLLRFFKDNEVFTYHQAGRPKPAPDLFIFAANQMGVFDVKRCLVIEDSDTGALAANEAGMDVVIIQRHDNPRLASIESLCIKGFVKDLTEVMQFLQD